MGTLAAEGRSAVEMSRQLWLPRELVSLFTWNNTPEGLSAALTSSSELYAAQCDVGGRLLGSAMTPLIVILIGGSVSISVIGLFMPLIKLLNDLS